MGNKLILSPVDGRDPIQVSGVVANLKFGPGKRKFFIQGEPHYLLDYATGYRLTPGDTINDHKVRHMVHWGSYSTITSRQAAQLIVDLIVAQHGLDKVLEVMNSKPRINP